VRRGAVSVVVVLLALPVASTAAAQPATGTWRGANADGVRISFAVVKQGRQRVVTGIVMGCDNLGRTFAASHAPTDLLFFNREGNHPIGAPNVHAAFPLKRSGRIDTRLRYIRPSPGSASFERPEPTTSPIRGRLGRRRGTVTFRSAEEWGAWGSSVCDEGGSNSNPDAGDAVEVSRIGTGARPGVWRLSGLLPFGDIADYAVARFYVQPSGVAGSFRGMFLGPAAIPPSRRPNPLYSPWPAPCFSQNIASGLLAEGSMEYDWPETFIIEPTQVEPDGTMVTAGGDQPGSLAWVSTSGRFTSATHYRGTYRITENPALTNPNWCVDVDIPFEADWERSTSPIVVGARHEGRATRPGRVRGVLPVPSEPLDYVALGDSYSSGEGVPPFDPDSNTADDRCHRSTLAYSRVFAPGTYRLRRSFFACSGAVTENVGMLDAAGAPGGTVQYPPEGTVQLGRLDATRWSDTDMVTLTIGGNDAGFAGVLTRCLVLRCHRGRAARRLIFKISREVRPKLASTYASLARTAPNATVFVLGYPQLFPERPRRRCPIGKRVVSADKQRFLRRRGEQLNRVIRNAAAQAGFHFVGVERAFAGHEPCGRKKEWIHAIVLPRNRVYSFHPNQRGQRAYADRLEGYLTCLAGAGWQFRGSGMPVPPTSSRRQPRACAE
jgi:GDSL-like Lipase/Acylhydrolase family